MLIEKNSIVVEVTKSGVHIYDNPIGVLTNNPEFNYQMYNLNKYRNLSISTPQNTFSDSVDLKVDGTGFGGIGLPGDVSPESRFVRVAFSKLNSSKGTNRRRRYYSVFPYTRDSRTDKGR